MALKDVALKTKNLPFLVIFVMANYAVFAILNNLPWKLIKEVKLKENLTFENSLLVIGLHLGVLIFSYFLSANIKDTLVFWKIKNPLPGCRAFSDLAPKDSRIDIPLLKKKYGNFPRSPENQNKLWYKIFKEHQDQPAIKQSHGAWLLFRELTAISFLFLILLSVATLLIKSSSTLLLAYGGGLAAQYTIIAVAAANAGRRFVCNVLARGVDSPSETKESQST